MKKVLAIVSVGVVLGMFNGCTVTPTTPDTVAISGLAVADSLAAGGTAVQIAGSIDGSATITSYYVHRSESGRHRCDVDVHDHL